MKKIFLLAAGIAILAVPTTAQITISPEAGVNLANIHERTTTAGGGTENKNGGIKIGVKAGANAEIWLGDHLAVQPGLFYSIKGAKFDDDQSFLGITFKYENNITLHYFEIPVNVQYYFNDPSEGRFFVGVGAYLGVAFSGKNKSHIEALGQSQDTVIDYKFGDDYSNNNLRRFDFGVAGNVGYLLRSGIFFRGSYQLGITNLVPAGNRPSTASDDKATNSNITISVGYVLGSKPKDKGARKKGSNDM